ncbi:proteasome subunit beta type-2-like [Planococcus citri]|uniref:proteasome subunit beta type-2-like n=1 Tax=Planococcus citri TaxID=170843 RepID=UPI0031F7D247
METLIGIACNDFVILASDMTHVNSLFVLKNDEDKLYRISKKLIMTVTGEAGDTVQFAEYIAKNIQLYKMRNGYELSPKAAATYTRRNLAEYLRSRTPYNVNLMLGGYDEKEGASLYLIDYLASMIQVPFTTNGYGGLITLSILDRYYKPDLTEDGAYNLILKCVQEIHKRLVLNLPNFKVTVVNKDGIKNLPDITPRTEPICN